MNRRILSSSLAPKHCETGIAKPVHSPITEPITRKFSDPTQPTAAGLRLGIIEEAEELKLDSRGSQVIRYYMFFEAQHELRQRTGDIFRGREEVRPFTSCTAWQEGPGQHRYSSVSVRHNLSLTSGT